MLRRCLRGIGARCRRWSFPAAATGEPSRPEPSRCSSPKGWSLNLLVGTSVGAVNAAVLAAEPTLERAAELVQVWAALSGRDVFPGSRIEPPGAPRAADHLYAPTGLRHLLERHLPHTRIEEAACPSWW